MIWGSIAQQELYEMIHPPIFFCRDLDELKEIFAIPADKGATPPLTLHEGLVHILSEDYKSEMYGYKLQFGGGLAEEGCIVEAIPLRYSASDTRLSFYSDVWDPFIIYADDHQGGHANRMDRIVRIAHRGSFLRSRD